MKRRRQVRRITIPHPLRSSGPKTPSICVECGEAIDLEAVQRALRDGLEAVHGCGRVLVRPAVCHDCGHALGPHRNRPKAPWCGSPDCDCRGWWPVYQPVDGEPTA